MAGRLISNDPLTRTREDFHVEGDSFIINQTQDTSEVEAFNKAEYNMESGRFGKGFQHRVARIPSAVWTDLMRRGIAQDSKALKKWLNDPDNRVFRTKPVRL